MVVIYFIGNNEYKEFETATLEDMYKYCITKKLLGIDIETSRKFEKGKYPENNYKPGLSPWFSKIIMIQIGDLKNQYVIDCRCFSIKILMKFLVPLFISDIRKVGHYLKFENVHFLHNFGVTLNNVWDTHICEKILYNGYTFGFTLKDLMERYLGIKSIQSVDLFNNIIKPSISFDSDSKFLLGITKEVDSEIFVDKSTRLQFLEIKNRKFTVQQIEYGATDITAPLKIYKEQVKGRLIDDKIWNPIKGFKLENKFIKVLARVEYKGMPFSSKKWMEVYDKNTKIYNYRLDFLNNYVINNYPNFTDAVNLFTNKAHCAIEWSSSKQTIVFFRHLNICPKERSKSTGRQEWTVGAKAMFKILENKNKLKFYKETFPDKIESTDDLVLAYLLLKKSEQLITTFGKDFLKYVNPITNRIHSNYNQFMISSRLSSNNPNLQNIPGNKDFRNCFTNGKPFINADFSGQESRVLAHVSQVPLLLDFYTKGHPIFGTDLHSFAGTLMKRALTGDDTVIVTKKTDPNMRQNAKAFNFKLSYGASAWTISQELGIELKEAETLVDAYFKGFKGLKKDFKDTMNLAVKRGWIQLDSYTDKRYFYPDFYRIKEIIEEAYTLTTYKQGEKIPEEEKIRLRADTNWSTLWREWGVLKGKLERRGLNLRIQGSAASQAKLAGILFYNRREDNSQELINFIHDEALADSKKELLEKTAILLSKCMSEAGEIITPSVKMPADAVISLVWEH